MVLVGYEIYVSSVSSSLFAELSRKVSSPLMLFVIRDSQSSLFLTFAFLPERLSTNVFDEVFRYSRESKKVVKVSRYLVKGGMSFIAFKERCEFLDLLYSYNVQVLMPYIISAGSRLFYVVGEDNNVERFIGNMLSYYGSRNVFLKRLQASEVIHRHVKAITRYFATSPLTEKEFKVLTKAFLEGFLSERRDAKLSDVAKSLGLSKPATSIMIRKALRKVLGSILSGDY
jgi:predicted DNA binding protein